MSQSLTKRSDPHVEPPLVICSWCQKINVGDEEWLELEEALKSLGLFKHQMFPLLSHGMCDGCHEYMTQQVAKIT